MPARTSPACAPPVRPSTPADRRHVRHHVEHILPYTPDQLFQLVGDVTHYPEFVPWIVALDATPPVRTEEGIDRLDAEAQVGFSFLKERFATGVTRDANTHTIRVSLLRGPFRRLENCWRFEAHPSGTKVIFDIDFEFKSKLLDALLKANFNTAVDRLIACFEARAAALYRHI